MSTQKKQAGPDSTPSSLESVKPTSSSNPNFEGKLQRLARVAMTVSVVGMVLPGLLAGVPTTEAAPLLTKYHGVFEDYDLWGHRGTIGHYYCDVSGSQDGSYDVEETSFTEARLFESSPGSWRLWVHIEPPASCIEALSDGCPPLIVDIEKPLTYDSTYGFWEYGAGSIDPPNGEGLFTGACNRNPSQSTLSLGVRGIPSDGWLGDERISAFFYTTGCTTVVSPCNTVYDVIWIDFRRVGCDGGIETSPLSIC